jgi:predicted DCC family thiol-disulfide oxidoreductase YuxK
VKDDAHPVWLFDGVCMLCSRVVAHALAHERAPVIRFVAIQSEEGRALARRHAIDPDCPATFLFLDNGVAHAKMDGVIALARHMRGPARLAIALRVLPRPLRDWFYDRLARNRYRWFGRADSCIVPDAATRHRFSLPASVP